MTKRFLSLVMTIIMLSALFISCTDNKITNATTSNEPVSSTLSEQGTPTNVVSESPWDTSYDITPTPTPTCPPTDVGEDGMLKKLTEIIENGGFDEQEIGIIVSGGNTATRSIYVDTDAEDYDEADPINVAVDFRNKTIEDKLNVKLRIFRTIDMGGLINHIKEYLNSPENYYDIIGGYQYFDLGLAFGQNSETLVDYSEIAPEDMMINLNAGYWDRELYETLGLDGGNYWITGDLSQAWLSSMFVSFVNARIWKENISEIKKFTGGEEDIYKVVKNGLWSVDLWLELNEIVYKDDNRSGSVDDGDTVGFVGYAASCGISNNVVDGLFSGSHVTFSKKENGLPVISYPTTDLNNYAQAMKKLYNGSKSLLLPKCDYDRNVMHIFNEGKALMTVNILEQSEIFLSDMKDDYYILPPPKSNAEQDNYYTTRADYVNHFGILTKTENLRAATATLEVLGYYSKQEVTPKYYDKVLKNKYTGEESGDAAEMIDFIRSRSYSDFTLVWGLEFGNDGPSWYLRKNIGSSIDKEAVTTKMATNWEKQLDKLIKKLTAGADAGS